MNRIATRITQSYRLRLLFGYAVIVSLVAAGWAWSLYGPLSSAIVEQQQSHLQSVAQAAALALARGGAPSATVRQLVARTDLRATVVAADGRVLADSQADPARMENHGSRPEVRAALRGAIGRDTRVSRTQHVKEMYVAVPATLDGARVALRVAEPLTRIESLAADARRTGLLLLVGTIVLSLLVTGRLAERAAAPVLRLTESARSMSRGDLSTPVPSEPGELGVLSSALSDLKQQLRARVRTLEAERGDLRGVLDGLPDAVLLLEDGRVAVANSAASRMFRPPAAGWLGHRLEETTLPASVVGAVGRLGEGGVEEVGDAMHRQLLVATCELPSADDSARLLVAISDVTDRARLDLVRRDFVANASHELKTPASAIQLLAESAQAAAEDGDGAQALAFVAQISGEAARLSRLVQDLLDLSRLENGRGAHEATELRGAIDLAMTSHRLVAARRGLALDLDLDAVAGRDIYLAADPTDIAVLLDNLLDNAVKYTEAGTVSLRVEANDGQARLTVSDTGIGIPAEDLPRVFERFYRVDRARSRASGGTGLGLALVKHVVERSSGTISIASEVGTGTRVEVTLPLAS